MKKGLFTVRIFPDDETTHIIYENVTHCFWEANNTVLTLCLPEGKHAHWLREKIRHYDLIDHEKALEEQQRKAEQNQNTAAATVQSSFPPGYSTGCLGCP